MARIIIKKETHSLEIPPSDKSQWICMCGLSKTQPFCDKSHRKARDEEQGKIYRYNEDDTREEVSI